MTWDYTIKVTDVAIVFATLLGPVLAIQTQVWLEKRRALKSRRLGVFYALMRNRATPLAPDAVNGLNAVPLEFYGVERIVDAYRELIKHITSPQINPPVWGERRIDLLMDLIHKIAQAVGYKFDVAQLKAEYYNPQGHRTVEEEQNVIRQGMAKILRGEAALPMEVTKMPGDPEVAAALKALIKGETALLVRPDVPPEQRHRGAIPTREG